MVADETSELAKEDIRLFVDGREKTNFSYDAATDKLVHQSGRLSYGRHTVRVEATDEAGNTAEKTWGFNVKKKRR